MLNENTLQVRAIKHGTVIDHIPEKIGFTLLTLFDLTQTSQAITIGLNLPSHTLGKKDLIKIENIFLPNEQINQLALYAPLATINLIDNYHVVNKFNPQLPSSIQGVLTCPNSNCISRNEPVKSGFEIKKHQHEIQLCCQYCEKSFSRSVILRV